MYAVAILFTIICIYGAFNFNTSTDSQISLFIMGCLFASGLFISLFYDMKNKFTKKLGK